MKMINGIFVLLLFWQAGISQYTDSISQNELHWPDSAKTVHLGNVSVYGREKTHTQYLVHFFKANGAATLEDILGRLPEISLIRRGPYGMEPSIRSFSDGQINVLVDGMRMHGACTDKMDPVTTYIEPINLESLSLQTGESGQLKGASIGGTIDMKMAEPVFKEASSLWGSVYSGYQSVSKGIYEAVSLNYASGRWAFRGSGTYRQHQDYKDGNGEAVNFSAFRKANVSLSAKYKASVNTYLKADLLADDGRDIGYPALPMDVAFARAGMASLTMVTENRARSLYRLETKLYANRVKHAMDDSQRPDVPMHMDMPGYSATAGAYAEGSLRLKHHQQLQVRADISNTFLEASMTMYPPGEIPMYMLTWPGNRRQQAGMSAAWLVSPDSITNLRLTARADFVSSDLASEEAKDQVAITGSSTSRRTDFLPGVAAKLSREMGKNFEGAASVGYSERMPTASELYGFYLFNSRDGYDYIGRSGLSREKAWQLETSLSWRQKDLKIKLTGFGSWVSDYITGIIDSNYAVMTIGAKGVKIYQNSGQATMAGLEGSLQWTLARYVALVSTLRYTYAVGEDQKPLPFIAPFKNIGSVRYAKSRLSLQAEYEAALPQHRVNPAAGEMTTPGYCLVHARLGYILPVFKNKCALQAGVENLMDAAYREHLDWGTILRPGRNFYAQVKIDF